MEKKFYSVTEEKKTPFLFDENKNKNTRDVIILESLSKNSERKNINKPSAKFIHSGGFLFLLK